MTVIGYNAIQYNTSTIQKFVTRSMYVSWQNRRRGQSLVAHDRVKSSSKIVF